MTVSLARQQSPKTQNSSVWGGRFLWQLFCSLSSCHMEFFVVEISHFLPLVLMRKRKNKLHSTEAFSLWWTQGE